MDATIFLQSQDAVRFIDHGNQLLWSHPYRSEVGGYRWPHFEFNLAVEVARAEA
jgi:hypothetical protein